MAELGCQCPGSGGRQSSGLAVFPISVTILRYCRMLSHHALPQALQCAVSLWSWSRKEGIVGLTLCSMHGAVVLQAQPGACLYQLNTEVSFVQKAAVFPSKGVESF